MNTTNKIIRIVKERIEINIRIPHPMLVTLGIGIGVSLIAVLVLNMVDGMDGIQEADARKKLPKVEIETCHPSHVNRC
jgi:hypothetical protein